MKKIDIGIQAEEIALAHEKVRVGLDSNSDLVLLVSEDPKFGYDIESFESADEPDLPRYIEVKAVGSSREFFITVNEMRKLKALGSLGFLYLVDTLKGRVSHVVRDPINSGILAEIEAVTFKVKF